MNRVQSVAKKMDALTINNFIPSDKWSMAANKSWAQQMKLEGRKIIDIGPDFSRRLDLYKNDKQIYSPAYNLERFEFKNYDGYDKIFDRIGPLNFGNEGSSLLR